MGKGKKELHTSILQINILMDCKYTFICLKNNIFFHKRKCLQYNLFILGSLLLIVNYFYIFVGKTYTEMIAEASLSGFLKTLLVVFIIIIGIRLVMRILLPYMMKYFLKKVGKKIGEQFQQTQNQYQQQKQYGQQQKQTINDANAQSKNPQTTKKVGEYIDYEEVE